MTFVLLTAGACCAAFAAVTAILSWVAWAWPFGLLTGRRGRTSRSANTYFLLRVLPSACGLFAAFGLALPAFFAFEPRETGETPGIAFVLLAIAGAAWLTLGGVRAGLELWTAQRFSRHVSQQGRLLSLTGIPGPAYRIRHTFPLVTLVGIFRPRLFIAGQVLDCLTTAELDAVIAHETAHALKRDNLRRLVVRMAPGIAWPSAARRLERGWEESAEESCDDRAHNGTDLAAALVKVARLAVAGSRIQLPAASFYRGGPLTRRVTRLLADGRRATPPHENRIRVWLPVVVASALGVWLIPATRLPVHRAIELLVHLF